MTAKIIALACKLKLKLRVDCLQTSFLWQISPLLKAQHRGQATPVKWLKLGNFQLTNTTVGQFSLPERLPWLLIGLETLVVVGVNAEGLIP